MLTISRKIPVSGIHSAGRERFLSRNAMNFSLSDDERMVQEMVRDFAQSELKSQAPILDREHEMNLSNLARMAELGSIGMNTSETYAGSDLGGIKTSAPKEGNYCRLNGSKIF
jgi:alkylation response protein AidB-like acyl-CoA dehydrogenase